MSDRVKLVREIAARTEPGFLEVRPERRSKPNSQDSHGIPRGTTWQGGTLTEAEFRAEACFRKVTFLFGASTWTPRF